MFIALIDLPQSELRRSGIFWRCPPGAPSKILSLSAPAVGAAQTFAHLILHPTHLNPAFAAYRLTLETSHLTPPLLPLPCEPRKRAPRENENCKY